MGGEKINTEHKGGLTTSYNRRDFDIGPQTYRDEYLLQKIFDATRIASLDRVRIGDFMSGPGKVGLSFRERFPNHNYLFLDLSESQLKVIPSLGGIARIMGDVRSIPIAEGTLDIVVARYSIKDLQKSEQPYAIHNIKKVLRPGGVFVVADMFAPTSSVKEWLNTQHSLKQELGGRNIELEGRCHIPIEEEWLQMLRQSGFEPSISAYHVSRVETVSWVQGKQVTLEQLAILNHMILTAPQQVKKEFSIRSQTHGHWLTRRGLTLEEVREAGNNLKVEIDYPVIIIKAVNT